MLLCVDLVITCCNINNGPPSYVSFVPRSCRIQLLSRCFQTFIYISTIRTRNTGKLMPKRTRFQFSPFWQRLPSERRSMEPQREKSFPRLALKTPRYALQTNWLDSIPQSWPSRPQAYPTELLVDPADQLAGLNTQELAIQTRDGPINDSSR